MNTNIRNHLLRLIASRPHSNSVELRNDLKPLVRWFTTLRTEHALAALRDEGLVREDYIHSVRYYAITNEGIAWLKHQNAHRVVTTGVQSAPSTLPGASA